MLVKYEAQKIVGGSYKTDTHSKIPQLAIELDLEKTVLEHINLIVRDSGEIIGIKKIKKHIIVNLLSTFI